MLKPRAIELKCPKQGTKRPVSAGLELERCAAVRAIRARVEKGIDLLLEEVSLQGAEQLFGLGQGQPEMLDASVVLVEGDHIGDGLFMTLIPEHDELELDTHGGTLRV